MASRLHGASMGETSVPEGKTAIAKRAQPVGTCLKGQVLLRGGTSGKEDWIFWFWRGMMKV